MSDVFPCLKFDPSQGLPHFERDAEGKLAGFPKSARLEGAGLRLGHIYAAYICIYIYRYAHWHVLVTRLQPFVSQMNTVAMNSAIGACGKGQRWVAPAGFSLAMACERGLHPPLLLLCCPVPVFSFFWVRVALSTQQKKSALLLPWPRI